MPSPIYAALLAHIARYVTLTPAEADRVGDYFTCQTVPRKAYLLEAGQHGETEQRLYVLSAWRETTLFTPEEQALLALTEEVTFINHGVSDATYQQAVAVLSEQQVAQAIMMAVTINAWNRIAIFTHLPIAV